MANNRIQIYCKKCLEVKSIAKYYPPPSGWYCQGDPELNDFLTTHSDKCWMTDEEADQNWGTNMFGFRTQLDDDGFVSDYREKPYKLTQEPK